MPNIFPTNYTDKITLVAWDKVWGYDSESATPTIDWNKNFTLLAIYNYIISTITTSDISEWTNLYYTEARVTANTTVVWLWTDKADKTNVIEKDSTTAYTPTADYHPANKLYVDSVSPTTTKWDIIVNNWTSDIRLPVWLDSELLVVDSAEASGFKYTDPIVAFNRWADLLENIQVFGTFWYTGQTSTTLGTLPQMISYWGSWSNNNFYYNLAWIWGNDYLKYEEVEKIEFIFRAKLTSAAAAAKVLFWLSTSAWASVYDETSIERKVQIWIDPSENLYLVTWDGTATNTTALVAWDSDWHNFIFDINKWWSVTLFRDGISILTTTTNVFTDWNFLIAFWIWCADTWAAITTSPIATYITLA